MAEPNPESGPSELHGATEELVTRVILEEIGVDVPEGISQLALEAARLSERYPYDTKRHASREVWTEKVTRRTIFNWQAEVAHAEVTGAIDIDDYYTALVRKELLIPPPQRQRAGRGREQDMEKLTKEARYFYKGIHEFGDDELPHNAQRKLWLEKLTRLVKASILGKRDLEPGIDVVMFDLTPEQRHSIYAHVAGVEIH